MGCDIHMQVELFDWVRSEDDEVERWTRVISEPAAFGERNYALFGVLAGVRCVDMPLIAPPRGLPDDVTAEVMSDAALIGSDGHTHSWVTLAEVAAFDWAQLSSFGDGSTCKATCSDFLAWVESIWTGPTRIARRDPAKIRLVFWFDS
jgi:hypothetical protein